MFHLGAFYEDIDPAGALAFIAGVREDSYMVSGDDWRVPPALPALIGCAGIIGDGSGVQVQYQAPSLRVLAYLDVEPFVITNDVFGAPPEVMMFPEAPITLVPNENLNLQMNSNPAAAEAHYGLIWLADGPPQMVKGNIFTVRCTSTVAQAIATWTNGNMTWGSELPAGTYQVVGFRCRTTDGVAARLVFSEQSPRPGVPCANAIADLDDTLFRQGNLGVFGQFEHTNPPTLDVIGGAAAAQTSFIDLIKVG
jgi:hypothetical protein